MAESSQNTGTMSDSLSRIPDNISLKYLPDQEKLSSKVLQKGLNYFTQGYIHEIKVFEFENKIRVEARCWPSLKKNQPPHLMHIKIMEEKCEDAYCSCKAGVSGHCSHVVGLIKSLQGFKQHNFTTIPDQLSCTSIPQQWHVPRGSKIKPVPLSHVVVARPKESRKRKPVVCQTDINKKVPKVDEKDMSHLSSLKGTPLECRIAPNIPKISTPLGDVQIGSILSYQTKYLRETTQITQECGNTSVTKASPVCLPDEFKPLDENTKCINPCNTEVQTRNQALSDHWFHERKGRLTASNFRKMLTRKSKPSEKFINSLFSKNDVKAKSLEYGKRHEKTAKEKYLKLYPSRHLHECGFVVNNDFSFLGAMPDGKLCDNGVCGN